MQSKIDSFFTKPVNALWGSLVVVLVGWILFQQSGLFPKLIGIVAMLFFGFGTVAIAWRLLRTKPSEAVAEIRYVDRPDDIILQKVAIDDEEVQECWRRTGHHFQNLSATRINDEEFSWSVGLASGEFFRQGQNPEYSQAIYDAIRGVKGVRKTVREDHEHWAVNGDCDGEELARSVAFAIDQFLRKHYG